MAGRQMGVIILLIAVAIFLVACSSGRGIKSAANETSTVVPADENRGQEAPAEINWRCTGAPPPQETEASQPK
jgi:hypothetical protein